MALALVGTNKNYIIGSTGTVASISVSFPSNVKNGSLLACVAVTDFSNAGTDAAGFSSDVGDEFTHGVTPAAYDSVNISYVTDAVGGATEITFAPQSSDWTDLGIGEFDGHHQSPEDGSNDNIEVGGTALDTGTIATTAAGLLVFGCHIEGGRSWTQPTGFVSIWDDTGYDGAGGHGAYRITTASGSYDYAVTLSGSINHQEALQAFKEGDVRPRILAKSNASIISDTSPTATLTVPSGASDGYFFASVKWVSSASRTVNGVATSVSNGINGSGTALTAVGSSRVELSADSVYTGTQWWYGKNPSVGAHTLTATFAANPNEAVMEVFYVENVDGTTPFSDVQTMTDFTTATSKSFTFTTGDYTRALASGIEYVGSATQSVDVTAGHSQFAKTAANWWGIAAAVGDRFRSGATTGMTFSKSNGKAAVFSGFVLEPPSAGGGGVTGAGTPDSQASTVSGSGTTSSTGSGTPDSQTSTISGSGVVESVGAGATSAQTASMTGAGSPYTAGAGTPASQDAAITGAGTTESTAAGTLSAQGSTIAGAGSATVVGTGTITAGAAAIVGAGVSESIGAGTPAAQDSDINGVGTAVWTGSGTLPSQGAAISGAGITESTGADDITAGVAAISGAGITSSTGSGAIVADNATTIGVGEAGAPTGTGALSADLVVISGSGVTSSAGSGSPQADSATISGAGVSESTGSGALIVGLSAASGAGSGYTAASGSPQAQAAAISGAGITSSTGSGSLVAGLANMYGDDSIASDKWNRFLGRPGRDSGVSYQIRPV